MTISKPKPSEIWLVNFPYSNLSSVKIRPALVLSVHKDELIILGIFSKIPVEELPETWVLVSDRHPEFLQTGLRKSSLIRTDKISTANKEVFRRYLGVLPADLLPLVQKALKIALNIN